MDSRYREYLQSKAWAQIRIDLFSSRGRKCERCGSKKKLQIHHKTYVNIFKEEPNDLEILCELCHKKEHEIRRKVKKRKLKLRKKKKKVKGLSWHDKHYQGRYDSLRKRGIIK